MMKRICAVLLACCLFLLGGVAAYAETSVTLTPGDPGATDALDVSGHTAWQDAGPAAVPVREETAGYQPQSVESVTENGVLVVKKTYEVPPDADPQSLVQPFEQDGYTFAAREILSRELTGETLARQAQKTATAESETDKEAEILKHFPDAIDHEEDGYSGQLHLDASTLTTDAGEYESYTYPTAKTREVPGLERNDPSYLEREWNGMALSGMTFSQNADGRYTATAVYKGTATGSRPASYVTTAVYRGEVTKTAPGNMLYTVVYEGRPVIPPVTLPGEVPEPEAATEQQAAPEEPAPGAEPEPEPEAPAKGGAAAIILTGLAGILLGAAGMRYAPRLRIIIQKWEGKRNESHDENPANEA
jgi:hypothetical protein